MGTSGGEDSVLRAMTMSEGVFLVTFLKPRMAPSQGSAGIDRARSRQGVLKLRKA